MSRVTDLRTATTVSRTMFARPGRPAPRASTRTRSIVIRADLIGWWAVILLAAWWLG